MLKRILITVIAVLLMATVTVSRADWPMSGANPQRTSWVADEVAGTTGSHRMKWARPIEAYISAHVNLVCANGMIYVATARGLVAIDAVDGNIVWQYHTQLPMGDAPTYVDGYLYAPSCDRRIHKLNANDGAVVWASDYADSAFYTNPLVISGVVYATNRDGRLYAIDAGTGAINWTYPAAGTDPLGPIMFSPSYSAADEEIYFCSNDMHAYAVDTSGSCVWQSPKLPGVQFQAYWPTVYGDYLIFPVAHAYKFGQSPGTLSADVQTPGFDASFIKIENDAFFPGNPDPGNQRIGPVVSNPPGSWHHNRTVRDYSEACEFFEDDPTPLTMRHRPWMRQMIILRRSDGTEWTMDTDSDGYLEYAPIFYCGTKNGQAQPPVINGNDNVIYVNNFYSDSGSDATGRFRVMGWNFGTEFFSIHGGDSAMAESQVLSGGGNIIYRNLLCDRQGDWQNVVTGASGGFWVQGYAKPHHFTNPPYSDRMWAYKAGISDLAGFYGVIDDVPSHNGAYHNHGADQNPLIPYVYNTVGRAYTHRSNAVLCFAPEGTMTPSSPGDPLALTKFNREQNDSLTPPTAANLKSRLAREIQKIVGLPEGDMTPGYYCVGQATTTIKNLTQYFENPGDDLYVLSKAYRHLDDYPGLQAQLETYLAGQWSEYFSSTAYGRRGWNTGAERNQMVIPPDVAADMATKGKSTSSRWGSWSYPQYNLYAMYEYARAFPLLSATIHNRARSLIEWNYPSIDQDLIWEYNAWIMGYEGFLKLQELAGQTSDVVDGRTRTDIQNIANSMKQIRANNFQKNSPYSMGTGQWRKLNFCRNFMFLCPELGDYFHNNIAAQVQTAWDEYNFVAPYWMMARYTADVQEGTMSILFHYHAMFQGAAHALKMPCEELTKYLDVPAFNVGDMFYIDNLITAIEAPHAAPIINPDGGGIWIDPVQVEIILPAVPDANIYYTLDGNTPDSNSTSYTISFTLTEDTTVKAIAYVEGAAGEIATTIFTINTGLANQPPDVNAGTNQTIQMPTDTVILAGSFTDNTLTFPPTEITTEWSVVSGPAAVVFGNANELETTAQFSTYGTYVLRLTAYEDVLSDYDDVTITVEPKPNEAPEVDADADQQIILPDNTINLSGSVTDDGLPDPPASVTILWEKTAGPGPVTFGNASSLNTTATFTSAGTYTLQLNANDGEYDASDTLTVTVYPPVLPGTVAYLKLDDGAGDTALDSSGHGNNGSITGATWTSGVNSGALSIDGNPDHRITIPSSFMFDSTKGTWSVWIKTDGNWGVDGGSGGGSTTKGSAALITRHSASSSRSGANLFILPAGQTKVQIKDADANRYDLTGTATVTDNTWHHIALVYDQSVGGQIKIYVDANEDASGTTDIDWSFDSQDVLIADSPDDYWEEYAGLIDDVQIYNIPLSPDDITLLYNNPGQCKLTGDFNTDGAVDSFDLAILATQWLQPPDVPSADTCPPPDGDNIVDLLDFAVIADDWLNSN